MRIAYFIGRLWLWTIPDRSRIMPRMAKKPRKKTADVNQMAFRIVAESTGELPKTAPPQKDPAAVALGRKGGLKGGKARAAKMTKKQRSESAKKAALARWGKTKEEG